MGTNRHEETFGVIYYFDCGTAVIISWVQIYVKLIKLYTINLHSYCMPIIP